MRLVFRSLSGIVVPLTRLEPPVDVDQLALRQELAADLREAIPRHAGVIFGPLPVGAAELVRRDREGCQARSLPNSSAAAFKGPGNADSSSAPVPSGEMAVSPTARSNV